MICVVFIGEACGLGFGTLNGVLVGQASHPGPMHMLDVCEADCAFDDGSIDGIGGANDDGDVGDAWMDEPSSEDASLTAQPVAQPVPYTGYTPGPFKGHVQGAVYTTCNACTGYYPDSYGTPAYDREPRDDVLIPHAEATSYLRFDKDANFSSKCPLSLSFLLGGAYHDAEGIAQRGNPPARRKPRARKRPPKKHSKRGQVQGPIQLPEGATTLGISMQDDTHAALGLWAIDTCNPNAISSGLQYLEYSTADVACIQESRVVGDKLKTAERAALRAKWSLSIEPAKFTDAGGLSAGTAVAVRSHIGHSAPIGIPVFAELASRVKVSWVNSMCAGGVFVISLYLWTAEGLSARNLAVLQHVAWIIQRLRGPWLIGADWNVSPAMLIASGWLHLVGGAIRASGHATCGGNEYDFFVICRRLDCMVEAVFRINDAGFNPHSPVRLWIRGMARDLKIRVLLPPKKIHAMLPKGCLNESHSQGWEDVVSLDDPELWSQDLLNTDFIKWIVKAESDVADILSLDEGERARMNSRSKGHRFSIQPALGRPGSKCPKVSCITLAWKAIALWMTDCLVALSPNASTELCNKAARARWHLRFHDWSHLGNSIHASSFTSWASSIYAITLDCRASLVYAQWVARTRADRAVQHDCRKAEASFRSWLEEGPGTGLNLSKMHRMTRVQGGWVPSAVGKCLRDDVDGPPDPDGDFDSIEDPADLVPESFLECPCVAPLCSMSEANLLAKNWGGEWGTGTQQPPIAWPDMALEIPLPDVSCHILRTACDSFPCGTGLSWDKFHPRAIARLHDEALLALIRLFILAELVGNWPEVIGIVIICLLPKSDGGRRPIGLLPTPIRIWMRMRLDVVRAWQAINERPYFYAGPLKGATVASWKQAARAEWAASSDAIAYLCALLDLVKAFDRVPHDWLVEHAREFGYPMRLLKLSIRAYLLARVIVVEGICSSLVYALRGITAGSVFATVELRVLLIKCMDRVVCRFPSIDLSVYVDDTGLEALGPPRHAVSTLVGATQCLADSFQEMRISLSPTKNIVCGSSIALCKEVISQLPTIKFKVADRAKSLGAAITAGKVRNTSILKARLAAFKVRREQFRKIRRLVGVKNTHMLIRTGGLPALVYGQCNTGVSNSHLHAQRSSVAAAGVPSGAGDLDFTLIMMDGSPNGKADPAFAGHCDPIVSWAEAVWSSWLPLYVLTSIASSALNVLRVCMNPWNCVRGPGAAFVASAQRLGWKVNSATSAIDDRGNSIAFNRDPPAMIRFLVEKSVRRWRWRRIEAKCPTLKQGEGGFGAHIAPLQKFIQNRQTSANRWTPEHIGALCSSIANRQWTQARLVRAGLAPPHNVACRLCVAHGLCDAECRDDKFRGTLVHRLWTCPVTEPQRVQHVEPLLLQRVKSLIRADYTLPPAVVLLYTRALHRSLEPKLPSAPRESSFHWDIPPPPGGILVGRAYADGSRLYAEHKYCGLVARQGWAFTILNDQGRVIAAASGVTPWWVQGIYAAELYALLNATQHAAPSTPFYVDCQSVQVGSKNGDTWAHSPCRKFGRLWMPIMNAIDADPQRVKWLPAHCNESAIGVRCLSDGTLLSGDDLKANDSVDRAAKARARTSPPSGSDLTMIIETSSLVLSIAEWIAQITVLANHYPFTNSEGTKSILRDSEAKKRRPKIALKAWGKVKRKLGHEACSPDSVASMLKVPKVSHSRAPPCRQSVERERAFFCDKHKRSHPPSVKRRRFVYKDLVDRHNADFHHAWKANRDGMVAFTPPTHSAPVRLKAIHDRLEERGAGDTQGSQSLGPPSDPVRGVSRQQHTAPLPPAKKRRAISPGMRWVRTHVVAKYDIPQPLSLWQRIRSQDRVASSPIPVRGICSYCGDPLSTQMHVRGGPCPRSCPDVGPCSSPFQESRGKRPSSASSCADVRPVKKVPVVKAREGVSRDGYCLGCGDAITTPMHVQHGPCE